METVILIIALAMVACIIAGRLSRQIGVPSLLLFMALGMLFGSDGIFKIAFDDFAMAEKICSAALIFIMFYGGFGTRWDAAKPVACKAIVLSTLGVVITAGLTAVFCHIALRFTYLQSFLAGAVISSTDAASVFSILRSKKLGLKENTASLLEVESGSNDPASYMLTVAALSLMGKGSKQPIALLIFTQIGFGVLLGILVAALSILILRRTSLADGMDAIFVTAAALLSYGLPAFLGGNGYLGAYLAGIIIGNARIPNKVSLVHFFDGITGLAQILIFFLLGLLAFPKQIPAIIWPSVGIALFLTLVARPAACFLLLAPLRCSVWQCLLVSWAGLRGAASVVFAIMAVAGGAAIGHDLFHMVFCVSLLSVAFQGSLLPWVAKKLRMVDQEHNAGYTFNDYVDERDIHLTQFYIGTGHPWAGTPIGSCDLPEDSLAVVLRRGKENIIPNGNTVVQVGDLLVLSTLRYDMASGMSLRELPVESGSPWIGRPIKDLGIPDEVLIMLVKRQDGSTVVPKGGTIIQKGDILIVNDVSPVLE